MLSVVSVHGTPTYFPSNVHYMQNNLTAFGIFLMAIMFGFLIYCVWSVMKDFKTTCCNHFDRCRDKMYYKLMHENYELRKEYKRDFADLKEQMKALRDNADEERDS